MFEQFYFIHHYYTRNAGTTIVYFTVHAKLPRYECAQFLFSSIVFYHQIKFRGKYK